MANLSKTIRYWWLHQTIMIDKIIFMQVVGGSNFSVLCSLLNNVLIPCTNYLSWNPVWHPLTPFPFFTDTPEEKSPNITRGPQIYVRASERNYATEFFCSFSYTAKYPQKALFSVSWYRPVTFFGGKFGRISVFSEVVTTSPSKYIVRIGRDIPLGVTVCELKTVCDTKSFDISNYFCMIWSSLNEFLINCCPRVWDH